ncbi:4Fe-4S dicluster domain-containing protein [Thermococcus sp. CX2]|uniref:4Fe-4S dicluster domain-containing protein n=1 Tax=Thermococcus sp. CX2 TaxID=163006 RepID=UPI00143AC024|nr:4Fe-4S dicluster domain-containing protein [Thermococcus sp. CX2]NJE85362.1 4Fe-4S dicluster domain-containing protein [Thermococcus sp. CX2]
MVRKTVFIDFSKCIECRACEVACEREHNGMSFISVFEWQEMAAMALNCRHCEKAPCVEVCPTNALYRDEDGAVLLAPQKCIGCLMCGIVCPFGIPELDLINKVMGKCDLCAHRRAEGKLPACVETCPTDALLYGEFNEIIRKRREKFTEKTIELAKTGENIQLTGV